MAGSISVSVITPCYNGSRYLRATLESALRQSCPPAEILVVDDGSTDDSAAIADSFGPPVRLVRLGTNQGESAARNRGIEEASGSHLLFLDADDLLSPDALSHLVAALEGADPQAVALMGCAWFEQDPSQPYATRPARERRFFPEIIESNFAPPLCWLAPRSVVIAAGGFHAPLRWFEDWDLWWRVGVIGPPLVPVDVIGALYRRHPGSQLATTSMANRARGHVCLVERMAEALLGRPDLLEAYGREMFWACVTALNRARGQRVAWRELAPLAARLHEIARRGPEPVRASLTARAIRWVGVRTALRLQPLASPRAIVLPTERAGR